MHDLIVIIAFATMLLAPCVSAAFTTGQTTTSTSRARWSRSARSKSARLLPVYPVAGFPHSRPIRTNSRAALIALIPLYLTRYVIHCFFFMEQRYPLASARAAQHTH